MQLNEHLLVSLDNFVSKHVVPALLRLIISVLQLHIELLEVGVMFQLEVEHLQTVGPCAQLRHILLEELRLPERPLILQCF